ncbi:MAG: MBG domain-containing protein [Candidatus Didemnitutus sp.]|nr:MBG domain-containing protein [Candidatus Didemnitutus sp.]
MKLSRLLLSVLFAALSAVAVHATIGLGLQMQLGNPSNAAIDANNHTNYLSERAQFSLDYSDNNRQPNWVSWNLTSNDVGGSGRSPSFFVDTSLPANFYQVQTTDYSGSGYDRGHMCPSADRTISRADNDVTFFMSNMVPQTPDNNQGVWASFETYCRNVAAQGNELLIISGTSGFGGSTIASGVAIPGYTWKIVVVVPLGAGSAVDRIVAAGSSAIRVITIKVPNISGVRSTPWENFVTSPAQIQSDTGFNFFTALPGSIASAFRSMVDGQVPTGAPTITTQPNTQTTVVGGSATFSVTAVGDAPLSYQWLHDDVDLPGANSATLSLTNVQAADVGSYYVEVTNGVGSATSNAASLVVLGLPPVIVASPASQTVNAGVNVTFAVTVTGSPTLTYQWRKGGVAIPSATLPTLSLGNVQAADAASYDVVVTNSSGSATSATAFLTINAAAPTITGQPVAKTVTVSENVSFTVTASGTTPLSYQWRKGGTPLTDGGALSGTTTASLLITGAAAIHAGSYDVVVTNALGSATSAAAALTVNAAPPSAVYWDFGPSATPTAFPSSGLTADITGGELTQGNNNGTTQLINTTSASTPTSTFSGANNAGAAARIGALNKAAGGSAYFEFTLAPSPGKRLLASGLSFGSRSTSTGPAAYTVFSSLDGFTAPIASGALTVDSVWRMNTPAFTSVTGATGQAITIRIYGHSGAGSPGANIANWRIDDLRLTVNAVFPPPSASVVVSTTPANGAVAVPVTTPISVTLNQAVSVGGSWFSINIALNGPYAASVTVVPVTFTLSTPSTLSYNDSITVTIFGAQVFDLASGTIPGASNTTFSFTTAAFVPPTPPVITDQPVSQTVLVGANVTFNVTATGTAPLLYQWRKNGTPISGNSSASTASLSLTSVTTADTASYTCVVSNAAGSNVSNAASLTVNLAPPAITTQPVGQITAVGGQASFTVAASGTAPFTYQWRRGGLALANNAVVSGANTATLTLTGVTHADTGSYDVVVSNPAGSATSNTVAFAVTDAAASSIYWDFATASPTSGIPVGVSGGTLIQGNNNGTTTLITTVSVSSGYTGVSGTFNAGAAARIGALNKAANGSAYFEFTFTPDAGRQFVATGLSFGSRSTSTGPQAYSIFSSADGFTAPIATGTFLNDSAWRLHTPAFAGATGAPGAAVTFRIYGHNGTGSPGTNTANWRIDDLKLTAGLLALPPVPPAFVSVPADQTVTVGDDATFSVAVTGTAPFSFQWRKNGAAIPGNASAATATLVLTDVTTAAAGNYDCVVSNIAGSATSPAAALTVNKAVASVTLGNLSFVYSGSPASATATTDPLGLTVVFTYDGGPAAPVDAGSYTVVASIDDADYTGSALGTLTIAKATATVTLSNLAQTYDGTAKTATVTTAPAGLAVVTTYNGSASTPINAGSYAVASTVTDANYTGSGSGTLVISAAPATITLGGLVQAYNGTPRSVTVTTVPANLTVSVTYNGSPTAPTNPNDYAVVVTVTDPNYTGSLSDTMTITVTALVRNAPSLNGSVEGSVQVLLPGDVTLNGSAFISGSLLVPGTPTIKLNGKPTYGGTIDGTGSVSPSNYTVTLNGNALVSHVVRRTNAIAMPVVAAPPAPAGTRVVSLNRAGQSPGDFATLRDLTLNGNVGAVAVPPGTYGKFTANSNGTFTFGVAGGTDPVIYNLQGLTLNGNSKLQVVGPVIITLAKEVVLNSSAGASGHPSWLTLRIASGGLTLNGNVTLDGFVIAPSGEVTINGNSTLNGGVIADRLKINGDGLLHDILQ